jgi:hypothetical protein
MDLTIDDLMLLHSPGVEVSDAEFSAVRTFETRDASVRVLAYV